MKININSHFLSPQQKKQYSYKRDRRNCYGENAKSSRKNIPKNKQRGHQAERRITASLFQHLLNNNGVLEYTQDALKDKVKSKQLKRFKKCADLPLGMVLKQRALRFKIMR